MNNPTQSTIAVDAPSFRAEDISAELTRLRSRTTITIAAIIGTIGLWSVLAPLSGAVIAGGFMKVEKNAQLVQHTEGGIVKRLLVREGEHVRTGQPVLELEDTEARASLAIVTDQLDAETARLARLQAELDGHKTVAYPSTLLERKGSPSIGTILQRENEQFRARNQQTAEQRQQLGEQLQQITREIASLERQIEAAGQSEGYLLKQEKAFAQLLDQGFIAEARMLEVHRSVSEKREQLHDYESTLAQARERRADIQLRLGQVEASRRVDVTRELSEVQTRLFNLRERQLPFNENLRRRLLLAPASGTVNALRVFTEGGVVSPRETIMEITPDETRVIADLRISPTDVDEVHIGQEAEIELSGLSRRSTPLLKGNVVLVSSDLNSELNRPEAKFFVVRVELPKLPDGVVVRPGMPITGYLRTRERTALDLWLDPILGAIRLSFRET